LEIVKNRSFFSLDETKLPTSSKIKKPTAA